MDRQSDFPTIQTPVSGTPSSSGFPTDVSPPSAESTDRYKTELCRSFQEVGTCRYGNKCRFAHGKLELRQVDRHPKYKTEYCRTYHTSGFCPYGQRCHFIHSNQNSPKLDGSSPAESIRVHLPMASPERSEDRCRTKEERDGLFLSGVESTKHFWELGGAAELSQECQVDQKRLNAIEEERAMQECRREMRFLCLKQRLANDQMKLMEVERKALKVDELNRHSGCHLEPKLLELELSAIIQRRRRQLRCNSVGSGCETPPPFSSSFAPSRTSSPLSDETRSPMPAGSPYSVVSPDVPQQLHSPLHRIVFAKGLKANSPIQGRLGTKTSNPSIPKGTGSVPSSLWPLGEVRYPGSTSGLSSPRCLRFLSPSAVDQRASSGPYFVFDAETLLATLIQNS